MLEPLIIGAIVLTAIIYIGRRAWAAIAAARAPKGGCGSGCGCAPTASSAPRSSP